MAMNLPNGDGHDPINFNDLSFDFPTYIPVVATSTAMATPMWGMSRRRAPTPNSTWAMGLSQAF